MSNDLDDFMESIGLDVRPVDAADVLMTRLTGGPKGTGYTEIHNFRYFLRGELLAYFSLIEDGAIFQRRSNITKELVPFTRRDYAESRTKYYLLMRYHPYFYKDVAGFGVVDLDEMCKRVLAHPVIKPVVAAEGKDEVVKNSC